jgi:hypothetical protein
MTAVKGGCWALTAAPPYVYVCATAYHTCIRARMWTRRFPGGGLSLFAPHQVSSYY